MPVRRTRVDPEALDDLEYILPPERTDDGGLSLSDFLAFELQPAVQRLGQDLERFARPLDDSTWFAVLSGVYVRAILLYAEIDHAGVVVVTYVDIQP